MMSEKCKMVLEYLKSVNGANVTSADIANALKMPKQSVEGVITAGLGRKKLAERVPAEIELPDGTHKGVKFIRLTDEGMNFDPNAETEQKAE